MGLKAFFRAPQWEVTIISKIFLGLLAAYIILSILVIGIVVYYIVEKMFPETPPIEVINQGIFYVLILEFIIRFFFQQLPSANVSYWILLPIKKKTIIHNVLLRSSLSVFNLTPWLLYFPIAMVMIFEGMSVLKALIWFVNLLSLTLILNYLIFLMDKSKRLFMVVLTAILIGVGLSYFTDILLHEIFSKAIQWQYENPPAVIISLTLLLAIYGLAYRLLKSKFYLDMGLAKKPERMMRLGFTFLGGFGRLGALLKNDLRLLLRNVRPRQILFLSGLFLFYGLFFFTTEQYNENSVILVFASVIITGGFTLTYGQRVPSWDSEYYPLLMTQNLSYREYLDSKWWLIGLSVIISLIVSTFYLFFGWRIFAFIFAVAIYNLGLGTFITLYSGAYYYIPMKLNVKAKAFENTKALNLTQFLFAIPKMGLPPLIFWLADFFIGGYAGWLALVGAGILGLLLKNHILGHVAKIFKSRKYRTIEAFSKN